MNVTEKKRIYYLDVLRAIACLLVVIVHITTSYASNVSEKSNFLVGNFFDSIACIGVPIFIMVSGSLMLDEKYDYSHKKLFKHIIRLIIFFVFWSLLYSLIFYIIIPIINHEPINILVFLGNIIEGPVPLWFIPMIIGLYLIVPLLRLWVNDKNKKYVGYFILLSVIFSFTLPKFFYVGSKHISFLRHFDEILKYMDLSYVTGYIGYFILGWYLNNCNFKNKKAIYGICLLSFLATFLGTIVFSFMLGKPIKLYDKSDVNMFFFAAMIFLIFKNKFGNANCSKNKLILSISKHSLGIYAIHPLMVYIVDIGLKSISINCAILAIPISFIVVCFVSYLISFVLNKIPLIKHVV